MKLQPESKKELLRIACGVSLCTAVMWVVFAALAQYIAPDNMGFLMNCSHIIVRTELSTGEGATLLTRDHGKVRAVAKGVRRTKSRFGGRLEPFMRVALLIRSTRCPLFPLWTYVPD